MTSPTSLQPSKPSVQTISLSIPLGLCIGAMNLFIIQQILHALPDLFPDETFGPFIAVFVSGAIAGAIQGVFLRPFARPVVIWLIASGLGWIAAYGLIRYFYAVNEIHTVLPTFGELALGLGLGFFVGTAQWLVLQQRWATAYLWIVSTVIVWSMAWAGMTLFLYAITGPAL